MIRIFAVSALLLSLAVASPASANAGALFAGAKLTAPLAGAVLVDTGPLDANVAAGISGQCDAASTPNALWRITVVVSAQASGIYRLVFKDAAGTVTKTMLFFVPAAQLVQLNLPQALPVLIGGRVQVQPDTNVAAGNVVAANIAVGFDQCV